MEVEDLGAALPSLKPRTDYPKRAKVPIRGIFRVNSRLRRVTLSHSLPSVSYRTWVESHALSHIKAGSVNYLSISLSN